MQDTRRRGMFVHYCKIFTSHIHRRGTKYATQLPVESKTKTLKVQKIPVELPAGTCHGEVVAFFFIWWADETPPAINVFL